MKNTTLFTVDNTLPHHAAFSKRKDIESVMKGLGIDYKVVLYHKHALNQIFYKVNDRDFTYIGKNLFNEYGAKVYRIDNDYDFVELAPNGDHTLIGKFNYNLPFAIVNQGSREWFAIDEGSTTPVYAYVEGVK